MLYKINSILNYLLNTKRIFFDCIYLVILLRKKTSTYLIQQY